MTSEGFVLHERLAADCLTVGDLPLCRVLLMNDARFPWLILVPRRPDIREVFELEGGDQAALFAETTLTGQRLLNLCGGEKLNFAALGNQVPQLHMHVISRRSDDPAWPAPIWGVGEAEPYPADERDDILATLRATLGLS